MSEANIPSRSQVKTEKKALGNLGGKYRVREGYSVAYGPRKDLDGHVGHHAHALAGEEVELSHDEAVSVIKLTKDQKDPATGRANGPAIETVASYEARMEAERANAEFMKELSVSLPGATADL